VIIQYAERKSKELPIATAGEISVILTVPRKHVFMHKGTEDLKHHVEKTLVVQQKNILSCQNPHFIRRVKI